VTPSVSQLPDHPVARPLRAAALVGAVLALWGSALVSLPVPGSPVPVTLQTLAVLAAGILLGPRQGVLAVAAYLLAGALGLPLFAGGAAGPAVLLGPTGGFLFGFLPAALVAASWSRRPAPRHLGGQWLGMLVAHLIILSCGWLRLALEIGALPALEKGVLPFLLGAWVKSLLAAILAVAVRRRRGA
jgi:biotin transport system substrate-specific component